MKLLDQEFELFGPLLLPSRDNAATKRIREVKRLDWDSGFNEIPEIRALQPGQVVFDVGAYIGDTAQTFLRRKCEVHAFEPRPDNFICLLHNCPQAHCYNLALGDGNRYRTDTRGGNMGAYPLLPGAKYSVRLDELHAEQIDFLKIDVEGFEPHVIRGGVQTILRLHPTIHVECNDPALAAHGASRDTIFEQLTRLGYKSFRCVYSCGPSQTDWICT